MGRVLGVDIDIGEGVDGGREYYVPGFGRVLVDTYFDGAEHVDLCGERFKCRFEFQCCVATYIVAPFQLECYDMFYHCYAVFCSGEIGTAHGVGI